MRLGLSRTGGRLLCLCLAVILVSAVTLGQAEARYASIVVDAETGKVLYARNPDTRRYPASLTKIMTLYMVFSALEEKRITMDTEFKVSHRAAGQAPSKLGLKAGSTIKVRDAVLALVTKSANDAATVIAENLSGTEIRFARDMTERARGLGMRKTQFRNASGLPNRRQLSTARDMALLGRAIMRDFPEYYKLFNTRSFTYGGRTYGNHNNLLHSYKGTDGIKTGYINASGFNLVASVERNGRRLVGVVFGGKSARSRDSHMADLLDRSFGGATVYANQGGVTPADRTLRAKIEKPLLPPATASQVADTWGIQVGAFRNYGPARIAAEDAHLKLKSRIGDAQIMVQNHVVNGATYFRARLVGLSEADAETACMSLKRRNKSCLLIAPAKGKDLADISG
ncbi:D-alanyl-D-alanine carboxypeptidase [Alphaproteobacteria bacterium HT1-32]|nr:D-alanyl-D-alanine carboxypeptidase [Alphaproteobacteria bacterium HT1-32]